MAKTKKHMSYERKKSLVGYLFISPWLIGLIVLFIGPLIRSFVYTFNKIQIETSGLKMTFIGLENYKHAFIVDPDYVRTLASSIGGMLYQVPMIVIFSLFIAIILNQKFKGRTVVRSIFFLPVIIASGIIINILNGDVLSQMMMSGEKSSTLFQSSAMRSMLLQAGVNGQIVKLFTGMVNNIFGLSWKSGVQILLFLAGLQTIPGALYEAASIEGATAWESFWKITFPMISPIMLLSLVYTIIDNFTDYSNPVMQMVSKLAKNLDFAYSSTLVWIYSAVVFLIIIIINKIVNKYVYYMVE